MIGLIRSEFRKVLTTRLWWGLLIGVVSVSLLLSVVSAFLIGVDTGNGSPSTSLHDAAAARSVYTAGLSTAYLFALAFGVIAMSGEFRHQTITATMLASPRRSRVVIAKLAMVAGVGIGYGLASVAGGVLGGLPVVLFRDGVTALDSATTWRALGLAVVAMALWTILGLGIGTLLRSQVLALLIAIGVGWIVDPLVALLLNAADLGSIARFMPGQATSAVTSPVTSSSGNLTITLLPWWGGALVLLGYALLSGGAGAAITLRRDLT